MMILDIFDFEYMPKYFLHELIIPKINFINPINLLILHILISHKQLPIK